MSKANTVKQPCAAKPKGGVPAGCAAVIETAAGMMLFGERDIGRQMLEELLRTASSAGCAQRPQCSAAVERVSELLREEPDETLPEARRA